MKSKLSYAIAAILGGVSAGPAFAADNSADSLGEIIVTAQRRSESIQNVPISMQAFTQRALSELNIQTFEDYIKYLPNVTSANNGPGQNEIFMRGLSAGAQPSQGSGSTAAFPNVAIYLDNQSGQLPGRNLDVYAADLNRIEVLEGPQGTLFGSGAEAGMIRYITNEPRLNVTEGSIKAGYGVTAHGDPNSDLTAVLNLPLISDKMAIRGVFYSDHRGGYIDNVPATFTRRNTDVGMHYANFPATQNEDGSYSCPNGLPSNGWCVPPGAAKANNYAIAGRAINPVVYQGLRVEALYKFSEDWDLLLSQSYQNMSADGVFYQQPTGSDGETLKPLEVTLFNPSYDKDKFSSTAWTVNGKFGPIKAVYTGGYLIRKVEQVNDYTNYSRGVYADYYQCHGASEVNPSTCYSPAVIWRSVERNEHWQHEFRVSTPDEWRLRGIAGVYVQDNKLYDQSDWRYKTVPACTSNTDPGTPGNTDCFTPIGQFPGTTVVDPGVRDANSSFFQDDVRETKQTAIFASFDYDIIPKVLTATIGARHFKFKNSLKGNVAISFYCFQGGLPAGGCQQGYDLDSMGLEDTESGTKTRANLTWHVTPDVMVYYTFSQGFRPGGFNQNGGALHAYGPDGVAQYAVPRSYQSDKLANNEIGWKAEFLNHRLQWNGSVYRENWDNVQVAFFNPGLVGNVFYNTNGQNFLLKGLETSLVFRVLPGLTLQAAGSWNQSKQTNSPSLIVNNPDSVNFGQPLTKNCDSAGENCADVVNPFGPIGSPTANSPPLQFSVRARYGWSIGENEAFLQVGASHVGHSYTQAGSNPSIAEAGGITTGRLRFENPAYTVWDASFGISKDQWNVSIVAENLTNSNAAVFTSTDQFIVAQTPLRPRTIGMSIGWKF
jgi:outer membrane receptor protein involved in Fe transport